MSYRPMVFVHGEWAGNALRFASRDEADTHAYLLCNRWTLCEAFRVDESDDPVNYALVNGRLVPATDEVTA